MTNNTSLLSRFSSRSDLHQSPMHAKTLKQLGWNAIKTGEDQIFFRTIGPLTIAKFQRPKNIDPEFLSQFRKKYHTLTTYIEPGINSVYENGFRVEPFAHSKTSLLDLSLSNAEILTSFSQKTRYNINHSLKLNKLEIVSKPLDKINDQYINDFYSLHEHWSKRKNLISYPLNLLQAIFKSFRDSGSLHLAYLNSTPVATILNLYHDHVSTYYAAFATPAGLSHFAPTLLTWQSLLTSQNAGCDIYDFGGIYDPRYPKMYKNWQGFTKFKAGFHPTTLEYPETRLHLFW